MLSGAAENARSPMQASRRNSVFRWILAVHGVVFCWTEITGVWKGWGLAGLIYSYAAYIPLQLAVAFGLWVAARRAALPLGARRALRFFSASFAVMAAGSAVLLGLALTEHGNEARYNLSDCFYVLQYPLQFVALLLLPRALGEPLPRSRQWLDLVVLGLATVILVAAQVELQASWAGWSLILASIYPNLGVVVLFAANRAITHGLPVPSRRAWRLLLVVLVVNQLSEIFLQLMYATGYTGPNWAVPIGVAVNLAMLWVADWYAHDPINPAEQSAPTVVPFSPLPLLMTAGAAVVLLLVVWTNANGVVQFILAALIGLNLIVLTREFIMVSDAISLVRRQAQRASEQRFEAMIRLSSDLILVVDDQLGISFASPAARPLLGCEPESLLGQPLAGLVQPEDSAVFTAFLRDAITNPHAGPGAVNVRLRHGTGTWRSLECQATNLLHEPAVRGIVLNARDVTERRALEERLGQSQKMEVVGQLAGGVAHDFNNLLTAILGGSELAISDLPEGHPVRRDLEAIKAAAQRGAALTKRLLAFSRPSTTGAVPLPAGEQVESIAVLMRHLLGDSHPLQLRIEAGAGLIVVDPVVLEHSLLNLTTNARDALTGTGEVVVTVARRTLAQPLDSVFLSAPAGDYVLVEVADSGSGMTEETQRRLFQPFFTTRGPGKGTGLGLAGVYGFMRESGGGITVVSAPGAGTRIGLWFPRRSAAGEGTFAPLAVPPAAAGRFLLVEDDAIVRQTAGRILTLAGHTLFEVGDPAEAREIFTREHGAFDLVISDVLMPGESGPALALWMRQQQPGLPVLLISGYPGEELARQGLNLAGVELLRKPFSIQELTAAIARARGR
jgi:PAS domain S-box-containing protein